MENQLQKGEEIWVGAPTNPGKHGDLSVKWIYRAKDGRISRAAPEVPEGICVEMILALIKQGRVSREDQKKILAALSLCRAK